MLKNHIKVALRNLAKHRLFSFINVFGLAFGMACVLLIVIFIRDELSYDKFHERAEDIYRVAWWSDDPQTRTPHPMAQALVKDFPQVESATSLSPLWGAGLTKATLSIRNLEKDITFDERNVLSVDSTFLDVFSFNLIKGNRKKVLRNVGGMLISESAARKYFGNEDPIGKQLAINRDDQLLEVEGIFADVPHNSHFNFDILISYVTLKSPDDPYYTWDDFGHFNYIRLAEGTDPLLFQNELMKWVKDYVDFSEEDISQIEESNMHFKLQRITNIHLHSRIRWELDTNGNIDYVIIMTGAAILILIMAIFNFMNLSTARSVERAKEIGVRKTIGAVGGQIKAQFMVESIATAVIAMILAGLMAEVSLPLFNALSGKSLSIQYIDNPMLAFIFMTIGLASGLLAGLYPAFFMSSFKPLNNMKAEATSPAGSGFRKSLIVFQFVMSMALLSGSIVIYEQLQYVNSRDLGFEKNNLLIVPIKNSMVLNKFDELRVELLAIPGVESVSGSSNIPSQQFNQNSIFDANDRQNETNASEVYVDYDIFKTLGVELVEGRGFNRDNPVDSSAFVINESSVKRLGLSNPVGKEIVWDWDNNGRPPLKGTVIGVVKDFNYNSLHEPIRPLLFYLTRAYNHLIIKLDDNSDKGIVKPIEEVWKQFDNRFEFEYSYLSDELNAQYGEESKTASVFSGFSLIAVFIACLGLFGIVSINFMQRSKEVSIRKILGASTSKLVYTLVSDFLKLILIAIVISVPVAWFVMEGWLNNFTFRVEINPLYFGLSAFILMLVALLAISHLTWNRLRQNPVDSLKE